MNPKRFATEFAVLLVATYFFVATIGSTHYCQWALAFLGPAFCSVSSVWLLEWVRNYYSSREEYQSSSQTDWFLLLMSIIVLTATGLSYLLSIVRILTFTEEWYIALIGLLVLVGIATRVVLSKPLKIQ